MRPRAPKAVRANGGFSLVELMIVMIVMSLFLIQVVRWSTDTTRRAGVELAKGRIEERVQVSLTRLRIDLRYAGYDPSQTIGTNPFFVTAAATQLAFKGDIDGDGVLETITYRQNGSTFERAVSDQNGGAFQPVSTYLQSLAFAYYDLHGNVTATLADIRKVKATMVFQSESIDFTHNPSAVNIINASETFVPRNLLL